ncbi:hypothetical protein LXL04_032324 [Taraxacum kok-saghyz]
MVSEPAFRTPVASTSLFRLIEPPALRGSVSVSHIGANTIYKWLYMLEYPLSPQRRLAIVNILGSGEEVWIGDIILKIGFLDYSANSILELDTIQFTRVSLRTQPQTIDVSIIQSLLKETTITMMTLITQTHNVGLSLENSIVKKRIPVERNFPLELYYLLKLIHHSDNIL